MSSQKKLKIDLSLLESILSKGNSYAVPVYLDVETGEALLETDMTLEEMEKQSRYLQIPADRVFSVSREAVERWVASTLQVLGENYDLEFALKVSSQLREAVTQLDSSNAVTDVLLKLNELDDNYFTDWLEFLEVEQYRNFESWLVENKIDLIK